MRRALTSLTLVAGLLLLETPAVDAQLFGCNIGTSGVSFGQYSVFNGTPTDAQGTVSYSCTLALLVRVELSRGSSSTFNPRTMTGGGGTLNYNLYLDSGRTTIWGDGSSGTSRISHVAVVLFPHQATVYGRIPSLQNASVGAYSDGVTATIVF
jgi:spore coat protein U-like protein